MLLDEPGAAAVRAIWDVSSAVTSVTLLAESRAALASAHRAQRITDDEHSRSVWELETRWQETTGLDVTEPVARRGGELAERCGLRGYDAIHLASAEACLREGDVMVVSDARLAGAAIAIGLDALVPAESY